MSSTASTAPSEGWWYQLDGDSKGPATADELRGLLAKGSVHLGTMVWHQAFGETWKRVDQTDLAIGAPPRMVPPPLAVVDDKWSKIFAHFDGSNGSQIKWSFLGFFFGPFYYFYLRLWRKGWVIVGLAFWISVVLDLLEAIPGIALLNKVAGIGVGAVCGVLVFRDYWRFKRFGERMWPKLAMLDNPWAIVVFVAAPIVATVAMIALESSEPTARAAYSSTEARSASVASRSPAMAIKESDRSRSTDETTQLSPLDHAAKNCSRWLQDTFDGASTNPYDADTKYTYKVNFTAGRMFRSPTYFGNHQALYFRASLDKTVNGQPGGFNDLPQHFCVLDDSFNVIGMENDVSDGLP